MLGLDLKRVLEADEPVRTALAGFHSLDQVLAYPEKLPTCYVINTGTTKGPGEHWVAVYLDSDSTCDYWDSYGTPPLESIYQRLVAFGCGPIRYNTRWLQGPLSRVCGLYCAYFLHMRCRGIALDTIVNSFESYDFAANDRLVVDLFAPLALSI